MPTYLVSLLVVAKSVYETKVFGMVPFEHIGVWHFCRPRPSGCQEEEKGVWYLTYLSQLYTVYVKYFDLVWQCSMVDRLLLKEI